MPDYEGINLFEFIIKFFENIKDFSVGMWTILSWEIPVKTIIYIFNPLILVINKFEVWSNYTDTLANLGNVSVFTLIFGGGIYLVVLFRLLAFIRSAVLL